MLQKLFKKFFWLLYFEKFLIALHAIYLGMQFTSCKSDPFSSLWAHFLPKSVQENANKFIAHFARNCCMHTIEVHFLTKSFHFLLKSTHFLRTVQTVKNDKNVGTHCLRFIDAYNWGHLRLAPFFAISPLSAEIRRIKMPKKCFAPSVIIYSNQPIFRLNSLKKAK